MSLKTVERTVIKKQQVVFCDLCNKEIEFSTNPLVTNQSVHVSDETEHYDFHSHCLLDKLKGSLAKDTKVRTSKKQSSKIRQ